MKTWLKGGLIIGFIGAIIGTIRLYLKFQGAFAPIKSEMFGKVGEMATSTPITFIMYIKGFLGWFMISFIVGAIIGLIIQKVRK